MNPKPKFSVEDLADALAQINEHVTEPKEMAAFYDRLRIDRDLLFEMAEGTVGEECSSAFILGFVLARVITTNSDG